MPLIDTLLLLAQGLVWALCLGWPAGQAYRAGGGPMLMRWAGRHLPYLWATGVMIVSYGLVPAWLFWAGRHAIDGIPYTLDSRRLALSLYLIGALVWQLAYWGIPALRGLNSGRIPARIARTRRSLSRLMSPLATAPRSVIWTLAALALSISLIDVLTSGVSLSSLLGLDGASRAPALYGLERRLPGLILAADIALPALIVGLGRGPWAARFLGGGVAMGWLALLAFRYRWLVMGLGVGAWVWLGIPARRRTWALPVLGGTLALALLWLTANRLYLGTGQRHRVGPSLAAAAPPMLVGDLSNTETFMAVITYRKAVGGGMDYGLSMIGYSLLAPVPGRLFDGGEKPMAPTRRWIRQTFDQTPAGQRRSPALSALEEHYLSGGWLGAALGMVLLALVCRLAQPRAPIGRDLPAASAGLSAGRTLTTALTLGWTYQYITRGYLPQSIVLAGALLTLPALVWYFYRPWPAHRLPTSDVAQSRTPRHP